MDVVVSFPVERTRRPGEDVPAIVAVRGCEIHTLGEHLAARRTPLTQEPVAEPASSLDFPGFSENPPRPRRRMRSLPPLSPVLPDEQKAEPLARVNNLTAEETRLEIARLIEGHDHGHIIETLVQLIGASNTHKPLPYGWPKMMYAIRGRLSLFVACNRTDTDQLIDAIRRILSEEGTTAWA